MRDRSLVEASEVVQKTKAKTIFVSDSVLTHFKIKIIVMVIIIIIIILVAVTIDIIIIRHQPKSCYVVIQFVLSWTVAKKMFSTKFLMTRGDRSKVA